MLISTIYQYYSMHTLWFNINLGGVMRNLCETVIGVDSALICGLVLYNLLNKQRDISVICPHKMSFTSNHFSKITFHKSSYAYCTYHRIV